LPTDAAAPDTEPHRRAALPPRPTSHCCGRRQKIAKIEMAFRRLFPIAAEAGISRYNSRLIPVSSE